MQEADTHMRLLHTLQAPPPAPTTALPVYPNPSTSTRRTGGEGAQRLARDAHLHRSPIMILEMA